MSEDETRGGLTPVQDTIANSLLFLHKLNSLPPHLERRLQKLYQGDRQNMNRENVANEIAFPPTDEEKRSLPTKGHLKDQLRRALEHPKLTHLSPREARQISDEEDKWAIVLKDFLEKASGTDKVLNDPTHRGQANENINRSAGRRLDWQLSVMVPLVQLVEPGLHRD